MTRVKDTQYTYCGKSEDVDQIVDQGKYEINSEDLQKIYDNFIERGIRYYTLEEWLDIYNIRKVKNSAKRSKK